MSIGMSLFFTVMLKRLVSELFERAEAALIASLCVFDLQEASGLVVSIFLIALTTLGIMRLREESIGASVARTWLEDLTSLAH